MEAIRYLFITKLRVEGELAGGRETGGEGKGWVAGVMVGGAW